jgi:hypothetical protein
VESSRLKHGLILLCTDIEREEQKILKEIKKLAAQVSGPLVMLIGHCRQSLIMAILLFSLQGESRRGAVKILAKDLVRSFFIYFDTVYVRRARQVADLRGVLCAEDGLLGDYSVPFFRSGPAKPRRRCSTAK